MSVDDRTPVPAVIDGVVLISAGDLNGFEFGSGVLNPYEDFRAKQPVARVQDGVFVYEGSFPVPLASALGHVVESTILLKKNDPQGAVREAQSAISTAPGEVQPEIAMGDALLALGRKDEARDHYGRARPRIESMTPGARAIWEKTLADKLAAAQ